MYAVWHNTVLIHFIYLIWNVLVIFINIMIVYSLSVRNRKISINKCHKSVFCEILAYSKRNAFIGANMEEGGVESNFFLTI